MSTSLTISSGQLRGAVVVVVVGVVVVVDVEVVEAVVVVDVLVGVVL